MRPQFVGIIRSATTSETGATLLREFISSRLLARVAEALDVPRMNLNAAASQMVGVVMFRYVIELEPMASASEEELVDSSRRRSSATWARERSLIVTRGLAADARRRGDGRTQSCPPQARRVRGPDVFSKLVS